MTTLAVGARSTLVAAEVSRVKDVGKRSTNLKLRFVEWPVDAISTSQPAGWYFCSCPVGSPFPSSNSVMSYSPMRQVPCHNPGGVKQMHMHGCHVLTSHPVGVQRGSVSQSTAAFRTWRRIKHDIPSKLYLQTPPQRRERYYLTYILPSYIFLDPSYQSKIPQQTL